MANITATECVRNSSVALTENAGAESQTIDFSGHDEKLALLVINDNTAEGGYTATVTVNSGDYIAKEAGDLTAEIGDGGAAKILGPFESARFKNTASQLSVEVSVTASGTVSSVKISPIVLP
jgi:hypothetical protein